MPSKRLVKDPERYKTVMCTTWVSTGQCPYNRKCQFAHGKEELRQRLVQSSPQSSQPQQQPPLPPPPMVPLPLPMGVGPSAPTLQGLPLPGMWPSPQQPLHHLCLPTSSSSAGVRASYTLPQPQMPPLPPGPPPSTPVLPLPLPIAAPGMAPPIAGAALPMRMKPAAPPAVAPPAEYDEDVLDELACAAMKWNLTSSDATGKPYPECLACDEDAASRWEPLRCNGLTGKVEPNLETRSLSSSLGMDSPIEPTLSKVGREASFQTQMVRRAISFILEDGPNSPVNARRTTAMAA